MQHQHHHANCGCNKRQVEVKREHKGLYHHGKNCGCGCNHKEEHVDTCYQGCNPPKKNVCSFEEQCEEEVIAGSTVRYKANCDEDSILTDLGIDKGDPIDYAIDRLGMAIQDMNFVQAPVIPGYPHLNSYISMITFLLQKIDSLEEKLDNITPCS